MIESVEAALLQIKQGLPYAIRRSLRRTRQLSRAGFFGRFRNDQTEEHVKSEPGFKRQNSIGDGVDGVAAHFAAAKRTEGAAGAGIEQAQIIGNFAGPCYR